MNKPKFSIIKKVSIGNKSKIYDQVNLYQCQIGEESKIDAFVYIEEGVVIGKHVKIRPFTFIPTGVSIGDNVFIGPNVTFTNDKYPKIGANWKLLKTTVKNGASIGAGSVILPGITIGSNSLVGAGSVVTKSVPRNVIVAGNPAKIIKRINIRKKK